MLKFSAYVFHYHQPPPDGLKVLFNKFLHRGRDFLQKVTNGWRWRPVLPGGATSDVVCAKARSAVYWQRSAATWRNIASNYLARNQRHGFAGKFAKSYREQWPVFGRGRDVDCYRGLAQKVAVFGFVGVAVSANGTPQHSGLFDAESNNIFRTIRSMFTVEPKHGQSELQLSIDSLGDLQLGDVIASDGCDVYFAAEVKQQCQEQDMSIETALVKDVEMLEQQQRQELNELMHVVLAQQARLRQLVPHVVNSDHSSGDSSALMTPASLDWTGSMDGVMDFVDKRRAEQSQMMAEILTAVGRQNSQLRDACCQRQTSSETSQSDVEKKTFYNVLVHEDDDDEGFVVIDCDENEDTWCDVSHHDVVEFPTMINFSKGCGTLTVAGQRETEPTQLPKVKLGGSVCVSDTKTSTVNTQDKTETLMLRVHMISSDGGPTGTVDDIPPTISQHLMHVNVVWWSHPTEPPDLDRRHRSVLPAHFNVAKTYAVCVTNLAGILSLSPRQNVLHDLTATFDVWRDFAVCTVMKPMKMSLGEFLSSHSVDIRHVELLLLQLMEAVIHLDRHQTSSRRLNSGGIFVELVNDEPHLVVTDYSSASQDDGDACSSDERVSVSSCSRCDLRSLAVVTREIINACSSSVPPVVDRLMKCLLNSEHQPRLNVVANALHMLLWAPRHWISDPALPDDTTVRWWLVRLAAVSHIYQCSNDDVSRSTPIVSSSLQRLFLSRVNATDVYDALSLLNTRR